MIKLKAIAIKPTSRAPMQTIDNAEITLEYGIASDFRGSAKARQISILSELSWQKTCDELGVDLPWTIRRVNLLVDGIEFNAEDVGKILRIGEVELKIAVETKPCFRMDEQHQGLTSALEPHWRGGVCCDVVKPGSIQTGNTVEID